MKRYSSRDEFRAAVNEHVSECDLHRHVVDVYHIQVLQDYRVAAAFVIAVLGVVEVDDKRWRGVIRQTMAECEEVLSDGSVYVMSDSDNFTNSRLLDEAVKKADEAVAHAVNLFNNIPLLLPDKIQAVALRARDICDAATKRMRIGY